MRLQAALIVRDEEDLLPACLESLLSLQPLLEGVRVYDTGSTDDTVAIARSAGCDVREGYWDGDFARARNEALGMCDSPWVLMIDADERVHADVPRLGRLLTNPGGVDAMSAVLDHVDPAGTPIGRSKYEKLLRRPRVRYVGKVHETLVVLGGGEVRGVQVPPEILRFTHHGYATQALRRRKAERNADLARNDVEAAERSGDSQRLAEALYHYARSVAGLGHTDQAQALLRRAWENFGAGSAGRARAASELVPLLLANERSDEALAFVRRHAVDGSSVQVRLLIASVAASQGRAADVLRALDGIPEEGDPLHEVSPEAVLLVRMSALDALGRTDEALACCLVLVATRQSFAHVPELLVRAGGASPESLAMLLRGAAEPEAVARLRAVLEGAGDAGPEVARHLA